MAVCPVCQEEIEITSQHHGTLFTCPHCNGVFFVDWSGQPETATAESPGEIVPPEGVDIPFTPASHFAPPVSVESELPPQEESWSGSEVSGGYESEEATLGGESPGERDSADLSEIADFGNADLAQVAFNYTLIISGIDSGKIREQIQEALTDEKFGWNVRQVIAQIKDGVLTIKSMNPVKASILMQRMKYLPVKVSWRQDVLSSTV